MVRPPHSNANSADPANVTVRGWFDFSRHRKFKLLCQTHLADISVRTIVIDLHEATYMDSSALGMIIQLKEQARAVGKAVELRGASGFVADVLKVADFDRLFAEGTKP